MKTKQTKPQIKIVAWDECDGWNFEAILENVAKFDRMTRDGNKLDLVMFEYYRQVMPSDLFDL